MTNLQTSVDGEIVRRYEYEDGTVTAADLGVPDEAATLDVLDDVVIVVVETGDDVTEREFELPDGDATVFMNNGVLTVEGEQ